MRSYSVNAEELLWRGVTPLGSYSGEELLRRGEELLR